MKVGRIALALILTLVLLFMARRLAMVQSRVMQNTSAGITISHQNPGKAFENRNFVVTARVTPVLSMGQKLLLNFTYGGNDSDWSAAEMSAKEAGSDTLAADINGQPKGENLFYYFEAQDSLGAVAASLGAEQNPLRLRFEGSVPAHIIVPHIFFMFAGAFFAFLSLFGAVQLLKNKGGVDAVAKKVAWTTLFVFIGGFPLGILVTRRALGGLGWGGFPLGNDMTDTKTLVIFLFWLILLILGKGSVFQKNAEKNLVKPATYGKLALVGFILLLGLYLIPHSL
jgi:hypothetical protein